MTPKPHLRTMTWLPALLLVACASPLPAPVLEPARAPHTHADSSEIANLLRYVAFIDTLRGPDLESEYRLSARELSDEPTPSNRLRMALLVTLAPGAVDEQPSAPALLEPLLRGPDVPRQSLRDLALLLHAVLEQRAALVQKLRSASAQLLYERKRAESAQQKLTSDIEVAAQKVRDQQARCELLERKIEEVKQIEKSMTQRPSTTPGRQ